MKLLFTAIGWLWCLASFCQTQMLCDLDKKTFRAGEDLRYQLYYNLGPIWISAGTCSFSVHSATWNKKDAYSLMLQGKTHKSFDSFYKVRDTIVSYVDPERIVPYKAFKFTHEDNWHGIDEFTFSPASNGWEVTTRLKRKKQWKEPEVSRTNRCGFDLITSIYRLRCLSDDRMYVAGRRIEIPVRLDDDEYSLFLTYLGKERIKLFGGGYYSAHAFSLTLIEGNIFKRGDVLKMWISDDGNKIPLLVESPIRVGYVKALFRNAENTLYPLATAKPK